MMKKIGVLFSALVLGGALLGLFGCATPPPPREASPELGELRGGGGKPMSNRYNPWVHPAVVP